MINKMLQRLTHDIAEKLVVILFAIFTILTPIHGMLITMFLFVLSDTVIGIYTTVKTKGWKSFSSHKLFNIVPKMFLYLGTIILTYLVNFHILNFSILGIDLVFCKTITMLWVYVELKSIDESIVKLGYRSIWVIFKEALFKIKDIKKDISDIRNEENS